MREASARQLETPAEFPKTCVGLHLQDKDILEQAGTQIALGTMGEEGKGLSCSVG
jgi:hypothetical protein